MIFFRCCQKRIKISAESVIANVTKIILGSCCILNEKSTGLQQRYQLCWWWICFWVSCHNKIKRPADLSIVKRLGGFSWCKDTHYFWISKGFAQKSWVIRYFLTFYSQIAAQKQEIARIEAAGKDLQCLVEFYAPFHKVQDYAEWEEIGKVSHELASSLQCSAMPLYLQRTPAASWGLNCYCWIFVP